MCAVGIGSHLFSTLLQHANRPADDTQNQFTDQTEGNAQLWAPHSVTPLEQPAAEPIVKLSPLPPQPHKPSHFNPLPKLPDQLHADSTNPQQNFPTIKPLPKLEKIQTRPLPALETLAPPALEQDHTNIRRLPSID